ncbi:hypothetical protein D3C77_649490 [compost metagenome]
MPFRLTVTVLPSAKSLLVPLIASDCPFSTALRTLSTEMALKPRLGRPVSTLTSLVTDPTLPARSVTVAVTVAVPSARPLMTLAGTPTLQLPLASSTVR